ncbi:hypothetical protein L1887_14806 [Cichorium endivia]|nr:hypothetical protein L1887_14806 [Cichorium endivia]
MKTNKSRVDTSVEVHQKREIEGTRLSLTLWKSKRIRALTEEDEVAIMGLHNSLMRMEQQPPNVCSDFLWRVCNKRVTAIAMLHSGGSMERLCFRDAIELQGQLQEEL